MFFGNDLAEQHRSLLVLKSGQRCVWGEEGGREVRDTARTADPDVFFPVESAMDWSENVYSLPHPTGWRAVLKKKK